MNQDLFDEQIRTLVEQSKSAETKLIIEAIRLQTAFLHTHYSSKGGVRAVSQPTSAINDWT